MVNWEYVVVPAPKKAPKVKGVKTGEGRFAHALTEVMNAYGAEGWEYLRSDTLPCEERSGFTGTKTTYQNMLVFRRAIEVDLPVHHLPPVDRIATPEQLAAELAPVAHPAPSYAPAPAAAAEPAPAPAPAAAAAPAPSEPARLSAAPRVDTAPRPDSAPRLTAARDPGAAPRLGPAPAESRIAAFPLSAVERKD